MEEIGKDCKAVKKSSKLGNQSAAN